MQDTVLITIDSLRADHVGHLGYERDTTPNIDALADDSASFTNAFAHACSTRPSFPSILTSSYAMMYGGFEQVSEKQTVVAEVFDEAGYQTAGFHSNLYLGAQFGYDRGFNTFYDSQTDPSLTARLRQWVKEQLDSDGLLYQALARAFYSTERHVGANVGAAYVPADEITDLAIDWITECDPDEPHFLWVHYMDVHHPYVPPAEYQLEFREDPLPERQAIRLRRKMLEEPDNVTDNELSDIIDLYDAEIRFADDEIGRLLSHVREVWGDVTTLVTADHGEEFRDHGRFSHHATFYDEVIHVPFILDDGDHAGEYEELVGLIDVPPTLVDSAGFSNPENFHGESLQRIFVDDWQREAVLGNWFDTDSKEERYAYRSDSWKYIRHQDRKELYDLEVDPEEADNVADDRPAIVAQCEDFLDDHRQEIDMTATDLGEVEMDEEVKERLRQLGYKE